MAADEGRGVIGRVIETSARNPLATILFVAAFGVWGWFSLKRAPLDAIPDLSDAQVVVFTEWMGRSPDLVEDQITYPISSALVSAPGVKAVRGQSMFGMSFVYVIFDDGTDLYWARSRVVEYLAQARARLPAGVTPTLGPDATGVGWVYQYALVDDTGTRDLSELRTLQDWHVRYALQSVKGVAEVATIGGKVKEYQVVLDPDRLLGYGVSTHDVVRAIQQSNLDVGGSVMEVAGHEQVVRGRGYVHAKADLEQVPLQVGPGGVPVLIRDVATVTLGPELRRGIADLDGRGEVTGGVVVMRYGENALDVIDGVKARIAELHLPDGVRLVPVYDRSELIRESIGTLRHTLIEEMVVVAVIIFLFLLHVRSAIVPILTLPLGVLLAFIPMDAQHLTANIMSLGGIAVAIGAMVDASIILIENVHKRIEEAEAGGPDRQAPQRRDPGDAGGRSVAVLLAARDHGVVPPGVHARGDRGPAVQAARVHQDLLDGFRRDPGGDPDPGAGRDLHPRQDPRRARQPGQPGPGRALRAGGAVRGPPPLAGHRVRGLR